MPDKNSTITYRWMREVRNQGRQDTVDEMMDANAGINGIEDLKEKGTAAFKQLFRNFKAPFPQLHIEVEDVVTQDD